MPRRRSRPSGLALTTRVPAGQPPEGRSAQDRTLLLPLLLRRLGLSKSLARMAFQLAMRKSTVNLPTNPQEQQAGPS